MNVETYDGNASGSGSFQTKIALFDQAGEGWPDVVFSTQNNDAAWASKETNGVQAFAAPVNKGWFDRRSSTASPPGSLDPLTVDGTVYGLRNDLAQSVFWYNKALFDQFGYEIPTTWEEYEALERQARCRAPGLHPRLRRRRVPRHARLLLGCAGSRSSSSTATRSAADISTPNSQSR